MRPYCQGCEAFFDNDELNYERYPIWDRDQPPEYIERCPVCDNEIIWVESEICIDCGDEFFKSDVIKFDGELFCKECYEKNKDQ